MFVGQPSSKLYLKVTEHPLTNAPEGYYSIPFGKYSQGIDTSLAIMNNLQNVALLF
jgi:hypothetical protein